MGSTVGLQAARAADRAGLPHRHHGDGPDRWHARSTLALGARGVPLTAFYGEEATSLHAQLGALTGPQLREAITQLYGIEA